MKFKVKVTDSVVSTTDKIRVAEVSNVSSNFNLELEEVAYQTWTAVKVKDKAFYININSLEDLKRYVVLAGGRVVIEEGEDKDDPFTFEVYNGYRE